MGIYICHLYAEEKMKESRTNKKYKLTLRKINKGEVIIISIFKT